MSRAKSNLGVRDAGSDRLTQECLSSKATHARFRISGLKRDGLAAFSPSGWLLRMCDRSPIRELNPHGKVVAINIERNVALAYNLRRVLNIVELPKLIGALPA
jgi:hypothetical protein